MTVVHVLDDLLSTAALDVQVDIRRALAFWREETLEEQTQTHGIGVGNAQRVADR